MPISVFSFFLFNFITKVIFICDQDLNKSLNGSQFQSHFQEIQNSTTSYIIIAISIQIYLKNHASLSFLLYSQHSQHKQERPRKNTKTRICMSFGTSQMELTSHQLVRSLVLFMKWVEEDRKEQCSEWVLVTWVLHFAPSWKMHGQKAQTCNHVSCPQVS